MRSRIRSASFWFVVLSSASRMRNGCVRPNWASYAAEPSAAVLAWGASLRIPPTLDGRKAAATLKKLLEKNPPYGAKVTLETEKSGSGWNAPQLSPWLEQAVADASKRYFGKPAAYIGEGGSIPFMGMLGEKFPAAQFLITGVLGPHSNAHGPNEFLHIPMGKRVTASVSRVIAEHHLASQRGETRGVAAVAGGEHHGDHGCC